MSNSYMLPRRGIPQRQTNSRVSENNQICGSRLDTLREKIHSHNNKLKQSIVLEQIKEIQVRIIQYNMMLQCIDKSHNEQNIDNNQYNTDRGYYLNKLLDNYRYYHNYIQHTIKDSELKIQLMEKIRTKIELITQEMSVGLRSDKIEVSNTLDYSTVLNGHLVFDENADEITSESNVDSMHQLYLNYNNTLKNEQSKKDTSALKVEEPPACCLSTIQYVLGFK